MAWLAWLAWTWYFWWHDCYLVYRAYKKIGRITGTSILGGIQYVFMSGIATYGDTAFAGWIVSISVGIAVLFDLTCDMTHLKENLKISDNCANLLKPSFFVPA